MTSEVGHNNWLISDLDHNDYKRACIVNIVKTSKT